MRRAVSIGLVFAAIALAAASAGLASQKPRLPSGFRDTVVFRGLDRPDAIRFARDGRVFVAEQGGEILVYKNIRARKPVVFANLSREVNSFWERGLLGLALAPGFPHVPYVYVLYTRDAVPGGKVPRWRDKCPNPPGFVKDGCVVTGTLSRLRARGSRMVGKEQVLIQDWCQQFPTHSVGDLRFGPDGALYAAAGEGAAFLKHDWGQYGGSKNSPTPRNPCGDPPAGRGGLERPPNAEGGSLRAQSLRRPAGQPVTLDGTIIRVSPATGAALPSNPLAHARNANARRIVAYGLRNPYRFTFRPGTNELWAGDVGEYLWEEIDRVVNPEKGPVPNFGWPCYEGPITHPGFSKLTLCKTLPPRKVVYPYFAYNHWQPAVKGDDCSVKPGAAITGLAFYEGHSYPAVYRNALFFADETRGCMWFMPAGANGLPRPKQARIFSIAVQHPVDLESGPAGDLYYVDVIHGTIHRISYSGTTK